MKRTRVPETISDVPNQPRPGRRHRSVSFQTDEWEPGELVARELGTSRNAVLEQMYRWWLRVPGVELPERPPPEVIERAFAEWRARQGDADE